MMKIAATLLVSLACASAFAQSTPAPLTTQAPVPDPKTAAAARDLLDAMNYRATTAAAVKQMTANMPTMMRSGAENSIRSNAKLSEKEKADKLAEVDRMVPQAVAAIKKVLEDPKLADEMMAEVVPLYSRYFTADEMKQLATFYRTPIGKKSLQVMPQLMGEGMQVGQRVIAPRINKLMQELNQQQLNQQQSKK
ncbi:DUF2059 domain-containing protein [Pseudoduganella umbonata]|nr:DUF2059 domain-containing protein [Pseudoduganella umbonata]MBB3223302.1 hypothetical protein [Pseudoduganella umbonata]